MKKIYLVALIVALGVVGVLGMEIAGYFVAEPESASACEITEMTYYYAEWCHVCQLVDNNGTISDLEELDVDVTKINVDEGPIKHKIRAIPTFVIDGEIYTGYKTFEQLKGLLKCE